MATTVRKPEAQRSETATAAIRPPVTLRLRPAIDLTPDLLLDLSRLNPELRFELTAEGELIVMSPSGWESGHQNAGITALLWLWADRDGTGAVSDSSTLFELPNKAVRSSDAAWVTNARLAAIPTEQRRKQLPLCPDFVIELRSPTDRLPALQDKMREYMDNGARLGWLIDPDHKRVYVYHPEIPVQQLDNPETLSADPVLTGFVLDLRKVW
ncbi:MAG: Uma2 family endonuclease [Chloroflexia bacterium]|nr:Uma2 family endonuclease [Chloroflexia bacterium]